METKDFFIEYETLSKKYNVLTNGLSRTYPQNMLERNFYLEFSTPVELGYKDFVLCKHSWTNLIQELVTNLVADKPQDVFELYKFKTSWSKQQVFYPEQITNSKKITKNLYINVNLTALHAVWLIQDLLAYYDIPLEETFLVVHIAPKGEKEPYKTEIKELMIKYFKEFLRDNKNQSDERIDKILHIIDIANKTLQKMTYSYNDFYLFDDTLYLYNYKVKFFEQVGKYAAFNEKQLKQIKYCLDLLTLFYAELKIASHKIINKKIVSIKPNGEFETMNVN